MYLDTLQIRYGSSEMPYIFELVVRKNNIIDVHAKKDSHIEQ